MDINDDLSCICGKRFLRSSAAANHRKSCTKTKSRVSSLLENAKRVWAMKKAKKGSLDTREDRAISPNLGMASNETDAPIQSSATAQEHLNESGSSPIAPQMIPVTVSINERGSDLPLAQRRTPRRKKESSKYAEFVPHSQCSSPTAPPPVRAPSPMCIVEEETTMISEPQPEMSVLEFNKPGFACSTLNRFRLFRKFISVPDAISDSEPEEQGFSDSREFYSQLRASSAHIQPANTSKSASNIPDPKRQEEHSDSIDLKPYPNLSSFLLGEWFWNGGTQKSQRDFSNLLEILKSKEFNIDDIQRTKWSSVNSALANPDHVTSTKGKESSEWMQKEVRIRVPFHSQQVSKEIGSGPKDFIAGNLRYRSIISIIRERMTGPDARDFHLSPYELYWSPRPNEPIQRVYGELYSSPAFIEAHEAVQRQSIEDNCTLPRVVVGLMFASDETHLAQFGDTKLWPLYMYFGNDSKYRRCKPSEHLCYHVAYFTKLPDTFKEFVSSHIGKKKVNPSLITHCIRELLHAQWEIILDEEFIEAYKHGIVILCFDGVKRRFFPRIFTYSADYKEKVIISGIRSIPAKCPCPRCFTQLRDFEDLGLPADRLSREDNIRKADGEYERLIAQARTNLYDAQYAIDGIHVDGVLKEASFAPTRNAFFSRLSGHGLDIFGMLVVDLMHEIESGNWKSLFIHLLRIIHCSDDKSLIHQVDSRYWQIPTFGGDTIRKFQRNVTEMKNLAARDWEDMLQCAIPVFDGLFPEPHNSNIIKLLHTLAYWHGIAKLRLHTDDSLDLLDTLTSRLGNAFRHFKSETCASFKTVELPKEVDARYRRNKTKSRPNEKDAGKSKQNPTLGVPQSHMEVDEAQTLVKDPTNATNTLKEFNLKTYKFHAFSDYVATIRRYGTTDSYSTEPGELEHRSSKNRYKRTSRKDYTGQMADIERRQARIRQIRSEIDSIYYCDEAPPAAGSHNSVSPVESSYVIAKSENHPIYLFDFLSRNQGDPAVKGFLANLKNHLLPRMRALFNLNDNHHGLSIFFQHERMYKHQTLRLSYETYDIRTKEDVINPDTPHCDIMMLKDKTELACQVDAHPFLYARVLGIYHVNVICAGVETNAPPPRMDFLWVRWYKHRPAREAGRLDELEFLPLDDERAFGFVDPLNVLRGCHIFPSFQSGKKQDNLMECPSDAFWYPKQRIRLQVQPIFTKNKKLRGLSKLAQDRDDWNTYHVNPFVDRDMIMRYHWNMAIGHRYCRKLPSLSYTLSQAYQCDDPSISASPDQGPPLATHHFQELLADSSQHPGPASNSHSTYGVVNDLDPIVRDGHYELPDPEAEVLGDDNSDLGVEGHIQGFYGADLQHNDVDELLSEAGESDGPDCN